MNIDEQIKEMLKMNLTASTLAREEALLELKRLQAELAVKDMAIADLRAENEELNEYIGAQARK